MNEVKISDLDINQLKLLAYEEFNWITNTQQLMQQRSNNLIILQQEIANKSKKEEVKVNDKQT